MDLRSHEVTAGYERAPARAMLRADRDDRRRLGQAPGGRGQPAGTRSRPATCPSPGWPSGPRPACGRRAASRIEFVTIAVSDGISMGHEGMRASLVSREVIADSVETVMSRRALRRPGHLRRLRQVPPRHDHGRRPAERARPSSSTEARSSPDGAPRARPSTSSACSRRSAPTPPAASPPRSWPSSSATPAPPSARARACSPPTPWRAVAEALGMSPARLGVGPRRRPPPRRPTPTPAARR